MRSWTAGVRSRRLWLVLLAAAAALATLTGLSRTGPDLPVDGHFARYVERSKLLPSRTAYDFYVKDRYQDWNCSASQILKTLESYEDLTRFHHCQRIFYNRVPKCGSRTLLSLFRTLSETHNFTVEMEPKLPEVRTQAAEVQFVRNFTRLQSPYIFSKHVHFINFSRFEIPPPIYINVIRDPMERLISHYSYNQYGSNNSPLNTPRPNYELSLDDCVAQGRTACIGKIQRILPYFCGLQKKCRSSPEERLAQAKRTVRENYLVVGITEDLPAFVEVLEALLPQLFSNATGTFLLMEEDLQNKTRTVAKPRVSEKTRLILKHVLAVDYEFYEFARQRFYALLDKVRSLGQKATRVRAKQEAIDKDWNSIYEQI